MKFCKLILSLIVICGLLTVSASAIDFTGIFEDSSNDQSGEVQQTTTDDYKAIEVSSKKDDGQLRVYLKSLNLPLSMTLQIQGEYSLNNDAGRRFKSGTQVIFSDGGDCIYMTIGGFTMNMGSEVRLTRQASDAQITGFAIVETQRANIYPGDLKIQLAEAGGGLKCIVTVNIEDYLHGVIAYEMSDAWPIEALKSQAIAARTYAMQRKAANASKDYDLVDTTADQVYRGTDITLLNVDAAIKATTGVVGTYNGRYATCYYTASNGGEVAMPSDVFGGTDADYGYLERREDPYDLENPNSVVKSISISDDCSENEELRELINEGIRAQAAAKGLDESGLELDSIISMEPVDPQPENSAMYRTLRITASAVRSEMYYSPAMDDIGAPTETTGVPSADMALSGIDVLRRVFKNSPYEGEEIFTEVDGEFTVDLDVYEQLKPLNLEINTLDCELISVEKGQLGYTISMRRFGHGVGMSQRGAQRMAGAHEMTWQEILAFYYPGMKLERMEWEMPELETLPALPEYIGTGVFTAPTVTEEAADLPDLVDGEHYAVVTLNNASSTLNMRSMPTTDARIIALLSEGQRLIVVGKADENGWVNVHTAQYSGYVKEEYLKDEA